MSGHFFGDKKRQAEFDYGQEKARITGIYNEISQSISELIADGCPLTEKDWRATRVDLVKTHGLDQKQADGVLARLRKAFDAAPAPAPSPVTTTIATTSTTTITTELAEEDWLPTTEWPGYAVDVCCRLKDMVGGKGRRPGRIITQTREWVSRNRPGKPAPGQGKQFRMYFQITVNGKRVKVPYYKVGMHRSRLEGQRKHGS